MASLGLFPKLKIYENRLKLRDDLAKESAPQVVVFAQRGLDKLNPNIYNFFFRKVKSFENELTEWTQETTLNSKSISLLLIQSLNLTMPLDNLSSSPKFKFKNVYLILDRFDLVNTNIGDIEKLKKICETIHVFFGDREKKGDLTSDLDIVKYYQISTLGREGEKLAARDQIAHVIFQAMQSEIEKPRFFVTNDGGIEMLSLRSSSSSSSSSNSPFLPPVTQPSTSTWRLGALALFILGMVGVGVFVYKRFAK